MFKFEVCKQPTSVLFSPLLRKKERKTHIIKPSHNNSWNLNEFDFRTSTLLLTHDNVRELLLHPLLLAGRENLLITTITQETSLQEAKCSYEDT